MFSIPFKCTIAAACLIIMISVNAHNAYADDAAMKLGRGIANIATGWVELPKEIMKKTENSGEAAGLLVAPFTGTVKAIGRTLAGVYETATFLIPAPRNYKPVIEPEYIF